MVNLQHSQGRVVGGPFSGAKVSILPDRGTEIMYRVQFLSFPSNAEIITSAALEIGAERSIKKTLVKLGDFADEVVEQQPSQASGDIRLESTAQKKPVVNSDPSESPVIQQIDPFAEEEAAILQKLLQSEKKNAEAKREEEIRRRQMTELMEEREERKRAVEAQKVAEEEDLKRHYQSQSLKMAALLKQVEEKCRVAENDPHASEQDISIPVPSLQNYSSKANNACQDTKAPQTGSPLEGEQSLEGEGAEKSPGDLPLAQKWLASTPAESQGKGAPMVKRVPAPPLHTLQHAQLHWCQRVGCSAQFSDNDNPEGSCVFHPGSPVFHDGGKEWSCCRQRSHDFSTFLAIPGCAKGKHTLEKPLIVPSEASSETIAASENAIQSTSSPMAPSAGQAVMKVSKSDCSRCRNNFFCSDHQKKETQKRISQKPSSPKKPNTNAHDPVIAVPAVKIVELSSPPPQDTVLEDEDFDQVKVCNNQGCGLKFCERENTQSACVHHPGPPVFHERKKGWSCCDVFVYDFDEFLKIPPCAVGRHRSQGN